MPAPLAVVVYYKKRWMESPWSAFLAREDWRSGQNAVDFLASRLRRLKVPVVFARESERLSFLRRGDRLAGAATQEVPADRTIFENLNEIAQDRRLRHLVLVDPRAAFLDLGLLKVQIQEHVAHSNDYTYPFDLPLGIAADVVSSGFLEQLASLGELSEPQISPWIGAHGGLCESEALKIGSLDARRAGIRSFYPLGRVLLDSPEHWRRGRKFLSSRGGKVGRSDALIDFWRKQDARVWEETKAEMDRASPRRSRRSRPARGGKVSVCSLLMSNGEFQSSVPRIGLEMMAASDRGRFSHSALVPSEGPVAEAVRAADIPMEVLEDDPGWLNKYQGNLDVLPQMREGAQAARFIKFFQAQRTQVLLAHVCHRPAWMAANLLRIPVLFYCHGRLAMSASGPDGFWFWRRNLSDWLWSDRFLACSRWTAEGLAEMGIPEERIRCVHYGIDLSAWNPSLYDGSEVRREQGWPEAAPLLLAAGRLDPNRRVELLLTAFRAIRKDFPEARLLLAGKASDPAYGRKLESLAAVLGIEDHTIFLGQRQDVARLLTAADVVVNPRSDDPFPRACIEAMAMGRPLVASCSGGMPEMAEQGKSAWLFAPEDPASLARGLKTLLEKPALRLRLGREARKRALRDYALARFVGEFERIWSEAARN